MCGPHAPDLLTRRIPKKNYGRMKKNYLTEKDYQSEKAAKMKATERGLVVILVFVLLFLTVILRFAI